MLLYQNFFSDLHLIIYQFTVAEGRESSADFRRG